MPKSLVTQLNLPNIPTISIKIENKDSQIWHKTRVILELVSAIVNNANIVINLNNEGPCAESLGLYNLLDDICDKFSYPKSKISLVTGNLIESHSEYTIIKNPNMMYLEKTKKFKVNNEKQFDNKFKHFGNFIGHGNLYRLRLAAYIYANHRPITVQTYHFDMSNNYHRSHIGLEDLLFNYGIDELPDAATLLSDAPITLDLIDSYPILLPETLNITKAYPNFFVEIANITYFSGTTFYVDEKIWRPMLMKTPFMVQGSQNFILNLHQLGFKTFGNWWDEGYSEDPAGFQLVGIKENIDQLAQLSISELSAMYQDMQPVLEHNWNRMQEISREDFLKIFVK